MTSEIKLDDPQPRHHCCLSHEFLKSATKHHNKTAAVHAAPSCGGSDVVFTFGDVLNSVNYLTSRLRSILANSHGSASGQSIYKPKMVGVYMPPCVEYICSVFSILRCGEAFLPLDPTWPNDRILAIICSSNADLVITSKSCFNELNQSIDWLLQSSSCNVLCFDMNESTEVCEFSALKLAWPCERENNSKRLFCYVMYTSGSTGTPKGVCGTEHGLLNRFLWMQELYPLHGEEILLFKTSISFVDHLQEFLGAMFTGCTLVIPPFNQLKRDPFSLVHYLQTYSVSRLIAVPSLIRAILSALQSQRNLQIQNSLKLLLLSGEVFPLSLWEVLSDLLPRTSILNLYGSTEVSGDCTYFDCKRLPMILELETLTSVPIGVPISNCDVVLLTETSTPNQGEICVIGACVCSGYSSDIAIIPFDSVKLHKNLICKCAVDNCGSQVYYRTGDFAQRLQSGDLVFLGRRDRTMKVNGNRVALEEVENALTRHPDVVDAAVIACEGPAKLMVLVAFLVLKNNEKYNESFRFSIRSWMAGNVPIAMIPDHFIFVASLPKSSSGKVDYASLETSALSNMNVPEKVADNDTSDLMHIIRKEICDALVLEDVSSDDDFFMIGGSSITAAQVSYNLGINMRLLYEFPTPFKLRGAILDNESYRSDVGTDTSWTSKSKLHSGNVSYPVKSESPNLTLGSRERLLKNYHRNNDHSTAVSKRLKVDLNKHIYSKYVSLGYDGSWSALMPITCSYSRCNKLMYERDHHSSETHQLTWSEEAARNGKGYLQELWKVHMESCVDASPLVVFKDHKAYLFIGSHSHKFVCVDANSGHIMWEVSLQGRIECSAAIVDDFSQVVVGCYEGKIYFLDFINGSICWSFQTLAEVKCQPIVDICRQIIWCGSHDHYLYALDYRNHCCIYKVSCGGSVFGSPAIDEVHETLYVASTSGRVTAISLKASPFHVLWQHELEVPVFGSLSVFPVNGSVICCLVDGNIVALDSSGSISLQYKTGGPLFAGACTSYVFPSQALICSRNGSVYAFETGHENLLWDYNVGDPIVSSAYVDEHLLLKSDSSPVSDSDRLVCVCSTSGTIHVLRVCINVAGRPNQPNKMVVEEIGKLDLPGDIFSSPVMIGGRIFVGCRDDYVHCISLESLSSVQE